MKIFILTTVKTTTTEPYTQLPSDRIELQLTPAEMIFLPNKAVLQKRYPNFWKMLLTQKIDLRADPAQLDGPLLAVLRNRVGIRIETDDLTEAAALLDLDEKDPIFTVKHPRETP